MHHRSHLTVDDHRHSWVILPRILRILPYILGGLVSSDLPRRRSCCDEQSHGRVILTHSYRYSRDLSNSPRQLPPIDDHCRSCVNLPRISLILCHIQIGLVSSGLTRRLSRTDEQSHRLLILTCISLLTKHIWPVLAPSDTSRWLPPIHDRHQHRVILSRISSIIQQTWPGSTPSDSSRWFLPIDDIVTVE